MSAVLRGEIEPERLLQDRWRFAYFAPLALIVGPPLGFMFLGIGMGGGLLPPVGAGFLYSYFLGLPCVFVVLITAGVVLTAAKRFRFFETAAIALIVPPTCLVTAGFISGLFRLGMHSLPSIVWDSIAIFGLTSMFATMICWALAGILAQKRALRKASGYPWWLHRDGQSEIDRFSRPTALPPDRSGEIDKS